MASPPNQTVSDLGDDEREHLADCIGLFIHLVEEEAKITPGDEDDTPELCDHIVRWWHSLSADQQPDADDVVWAIGAALGDFLTSCLDVEWKLVKDDEYEPSLALVGQGENDERLVLAPADSVAKRFGDRPGGFVVDYINGLFEIEQVKRFIRKDDERSEPDE